MLTPTATATKGNAQQPAQTARRSRRDKLMAMATLWNGDQPDSGEAMQVLVSNISLEGVAGRTNSPLIKGAVHYVKMLARPLELETADRLAGWRSREGPGF